jgi:hypothetical protein
MTDFIAELEAQNKALGKAYHKRGGDMAVLRNDLKKAKAERDKLRAALRKLDKDLETRNYLENSSLRTTIRAALGAERCRS